MTATDRNKAVVRRYKEGILNSRDLDALDEVVAVDYLDHAAFPGQGPGRDGLKQRVATLFMALDPQWTVHEIIAEADLVVIRWSHSGTHRGKFLGFPPTGKSFTQKGIDIYRIRDGKIAEHWNVVDMFGLLQQLGLIPGSQPMAASPAGGIDGSPEVISAARAANGGSTAGGLPEQLKGIAP